MKCGLENRCEAPLRAIIPADREASGILSHQLLVKRYFVALEPVTQSHQVLVFPGEPVASTSGISQCGMEQQDQSNDAAAECETRPRFNAPRFPGTCQACIFFKLLMTWRISFV